MFMARNGLSQAEGSLKTGRPTQSNEPQLRPAHQWDKILTLYRFSNSVWKAYHVWLKFTVIILGSVLTLILHESSLRLLGENELIFIFDCILNENKNPDLNWNDIDMNIPLPSWGLDLFSYILAQFAKGLLLQMLFFPIKRQLIRSHYQSAAVAEYRFPTWSNISFHECFHGKCGKDLFHH